MGSVLHFEPLTVIFPQSRNCAFLHTCTMRRPRGDIDCGGAGMLRSREGKARVRGVKRRRRVLMRRFILCESGWMFVCVCLSWVFAR